MTAIAQLKSSGLPVTWAAIRLCWNAPADGLALIPSLPVDELLSYAMDQISDGPPEQDGLLAELAFADERDTWTIQRCLDGLASQAADNIGHALRLWRWLLLDKLITDLQREADAAPDFGGPIYGIWTDEFRTRVYCDLRDFWAGFGPVSHDLDGLRGRIGADLIGELDASLLHVRETLEAYRAWLREEKGRLTGEYADASTRQAQP